MKILRWLLVLSMTGLAATAVAAERAPALTLLGATPLYRSFKQWIVACDNTRVCRAQPRDASGAMMIRRDPGPTGEVVVIVNSREPADPTLIQSGSITAKGRHGPIPASWVVDKTDGTATLKGADAARFIRAIVDADEVTYRAAGEGLSVPLTGMKAALLAIDENQGRIGGQTAFARPGPQPASQVPAALPIPILRIAKGPPPLAAAKRFAADVRRALAARLAKGDCEDGMRDQDAAYPLTVAEGMVLLACRLTAHDVTYLVARAPRAAPAQARAVALPMMSIEGSDPADNDGIYANLEWDAKTATLAEAGWSCAHACGENIDWVFTGGGFVLAQYYTYQPGGAEGLTVYRTETR